MRTVDRIYSDNFTFICVLMDYNNAIYNYIEHLWKVSELSKRKFAIYHNIEESTLRDILKKNNYQISIPTVYKICDSRSITPSQFFSEVERFSKINTR